jgi:hypothetical protein
LLGVNLAGYGPGLNFCSNYLGTQAIFTIGTQGNIGIGITSPSSKLHVNGEARITNLTVSNISVSSMLSNSITTTNLNSTLFRGVQYGKSGSTNSTVNTQLSASEVLSGYVHYNPYTGGSGTTLKLPNGSTLYAGAGVTVGSMIQCVVRYASGVGSGNINITSGDSGSTLITNGKNNFAEGGGQARMLTFFILSSTEYICFLND